MRELIVCDSLRGVLACVLLGFIAHKVPAHWLLFGGCIATGLADILYAIMKVDVTYFAYNFWSQLLGPMGVDVGGCRDGSVPLQKRIADTEHLPTFRCRRRIHLHHENGFRNGSCRYRIYASILQGTGHHMWGVFFHSCLYRRREESWNPEESAV